jgi:hypothetical protein
MYLLLLVQSMMQEQAYSLPTFLLVLVLVQMLVQMLVQALFV